MKRFQFLLFVVCFTTFTSLTGQSYGIDTLLWNGPADERINIVLIPDGYTSVELGKFQVDAEKILDELMSQSPFAEYDTFFNAVALLVPSSESGASHPGTATDVNEPVIPVIDVDNRFGSRFDVGNIHRLLVPGNRGEIFTVLADNFPLYDQVMVLVNTPNYGGSGGTFATTSLHPSAPEIAIHEIGHSFSGLADEYYAGDQYARESYNMTSNTDPLTVRWKNWYGEMGVGIYQHCCGGKSEEYYRPHQNCKMRRLGAPFCSVCKERTIDRIYELVDPVTELMPGEGTQRLYTGDTLRFFMDHLDNGQGNNRVEWTLDAEKVGRGKQLTLTEDSLNGPSQALQLTLFDPTPLSRSYWPDSAYRFSRNWEIENCSGMEMVPADTSLLCYGDSVLLRVKGAEEVTWFNNSVADSIWVYENGVYRASASKADCREEFTFDIDVFGPFRSTSPIVGLDRVMVGAEEEYTVEGQAGSIFEWEVVGGEVISGTSSSDTVVVKWITSPAEICVTEVTADGCRAEESCLVVDILFTHTNSYVPNDWILNWGPNPVTGNKAWVKGQLPGNSPTTWDLIDAGGRLVMNNELEMDPDGRFEIPLKTEDLIRGSYWLRIRQGNKVAWIQWSVQ